MKSAIYHATQLAEYALYGAGQDETPEQQDFAADCLEAAAILWLQTAEAITNDPPKKLRVCGEFFTEAELLAKVNEMRQKAEDMRNAAK